MTDSEQNNQLVFTSALGSKNLVEITFSKKTTSETVTRTYAPLDIGVSRKFSSNRNDYYHFYDLDNNHPVPLLPEQIYSMELLKNKFKPEDFVSWQPAWHIVRDWGVFS